jgi:hypothetical protein
MSFRSHSTPHETDPPPHDPGHKNRNYPPKKKQRKKKMRKCLGRLVGFLLGMHICVSLYLGERLLPLLLHEAAQVLLNDHDSCYDLHERRIYLRNPATWHCSDLLSSLNVPCSTPALTWDHYPGSDILKICQLRVSQTWYAMSEEEFIVWLQFNKKIGEFSIQCTLLLCFFECIRLLYHMALLL